MAYDASQRPGESLEAWYKRLATTADKRLQRLVILSKQQGYGDALNWAYRKAQNDIRKWSGENRSRWLTKPPENPEKLLAKITDIKTFLELPTSTKTGIKNVYKKRADTINQKYGTKLSAGDMSKLFQSKLWMEMMDADYGSDTAMKIIAAVSNRFKGKNREDTILDQVEKANGKIEFTDDKTLNKKVKEAVKEFGSDFEVLF